MSSLVEHCYISAITIRAFKSYESCRITGLGPGLSGFVGANGAGEECTSRSTTME